jgi:tRNA threonylcarbamoyladenosine biosynthesis protein TsaE
MPMGEVKRQKQAPSSLVSLVADSINASHQFGNRCPETLLIAQTTMDREAVIHYVFSGEDSFSRGMTIGLVGGLGVGKTAFVKAIFNHWFPEVADQVQSPTYNLCHIYQTRLGAVHHYDLFRVESEEGLYDIGLWESVAQAGTTSLIEWVNRFPALEKHCDLVITIDWVDDELKRDYQLKTKGYLNQPNPFD